MFIQRKQKGSAIITALTLMIVVASIAYLLFARQSTVTQQTILNMNANKAYFYHNFAVTQAQLYLTDTLAAQEIFIADDIAHIINPGFDFSVQLDNAIVNAALYDQQGRFNLNAFNNLSSPDDFLNIAQKFETLLSTLGVDNRFEIIDEIGDWLFSLPQPEFTSISQLRVLNGISAARYQDLLPHISLLVTSTPVNINTATIPTLMTLSNPDIPLDPRVLEIIINSRPIDETTLIAFINSFGFNPDDVSITSNYFLLATEVTLNVGKVTEQHFIFYTLLQNDPAGGSSPKINVVRESIGSRI